MPHIDTTVIGRNRSQKKLLGIKFETLMLEKSIQKLEITTLNLKFLQHSTTTLPY